MTLKDAPGWGLTRGERQAILLICTAALMGIGYRLYQRTTIPDSAPITAQDSAAIAAIHKASEIQALALSKPYYDDTSAVAFKDRSSLPGESTDLLDLNQATQAQLEALPGIGPVLASRILESRAQLGGFQRIEELLEVPGIGRGRLEQIRRLVTCRAKDGSSTPNLK